MSAQQNMETQEVMRRVSAHLDGLATEVNEIEHAIGDEIEQRSAIENTYIQRLQRLDYLRQSLEDLALLNRCIAENVSGSLDTKLSSRLSLATTKKLLDRQSSGTDAKLVSDHLGEVDFF